MYQITLQNNLYYEESFILDNETFTFVFKWNERAQEWSLDIKNGDEYIIEGIFLVFYTNILKLVASVKKPTGYLIVLPLSDNLTKITKDNLATDVGMFYIPKEEFEEDPFWSSLKIF